MIYLRNGVGPSVGPFKNRRDAELFMKLMELCGENWAGAEVAEEEGGANETVPQTDLNP